MSVLTKEKFVPFCQPDIGRQEEIAVLSVLRSGWLGYGLKAKEFENKFADVISVSTYPAYCVAVGSCSIALILSLYASGVRHGDEVITTPLTFAATINAILALGARPVFVDVDKSGLIDPMKIPDAITPLTQAIVPVHLWGSPCDMWTILNIANTHHLSVIEDAAQGFGGSYFERPLGTFGRFGCFSFYPTKNITSGDGGMVVCRTKEDAERISILASQGLNADAWKRYGNDEVKNYEVLTPGFKGLMNDVSAAIGLAQLARWPELREKRSQLWSVYEKAFGKKAAGHSRHIYEIRVRNRDAFRKQMNDYGIGTGIHYQSLTQEPAFKDFVRGPCPIAKKIGFETLSLPLGTKMTVGEVEFVVEVVNKIKRGIE